MASPRRGSSPLDTTYSYHSSGRDEPTIDSLLSHPMLRVQGPDQV
jgi:hypothetical protein